MHPSATLTGLKRHACPLVPMLFPSLGAHISDAEFQYPDLIWKEMCRQMAQLVGDSGCNKGQLTDLVKAICRVHTGTDPIVFGASLARS